MTDRAWPYAVWRIKKPGRPHLNLVVVPGAKLVAKLRERFGFAYLNA